MMDSDHCPVAKMYVIYILNVYLYLNEFSLFYGSEVIGHSGIDCCDSFDHYIYYICLTYKI